ncbi:MAG: hypothetical protein ACW972_12480, partial [Promethearchaeota archaeon]
MVNLKWDGKLEKEEIPEKNHNIAPFHVLDLYPTNSFNLKLTEGWQNLLIWGENRAVMNSLLKKFKNKISLIYIDPPFRTGGDFNLKIQIGEDGKYVDEVAYEDKWDKGLDSYLSFL